MPIPQGVVIFMSIASTFVSIMTASRRKAPEQIDEGDPGNQINTRSTEANLPVIYGTQKIGGNDVFIGVSGNNSEYLWVVQTLSEGTCDSIAQVASADQIWLGEKLESEFGSYVSYWFHSGSSSQSVDANLTAAFPEWTDPLRYTSYIVWKLQFNRDYFQSLPDRRILLKGRQLFDFRTGATLWSENPVLALYDYMTNARYGLGISSSKIDEASWTSTADYADTKGFTLNMVLKDAPAIDNINAIASHFRGQLIWFDGKYYLRYADLNDESSVMTIEDKHIAADEQGRAIVSISEPSRFDKPEGLEVRYIDPDLDYTVNRLPVGDATGAKKTIDLLGCADREMASNLGIYNLERAQLDRTVTGIFRDDCQKLDPHDIITFSSTALSISSQLMRVNNANILPGGLIELSLIYEALSLYDDDYDLTSEGTYQCTLPDPKAEPPGVSNVSISETAYNYRLRSFTRLNITFTAPGNFPWFDHIEVWQSFDNSSWEHLFDSTDDFEIANVQEGVTYYIRLKVVSIWGTKQQDSNDYKISHVVGGYVDAPDSLASLQAVVNQNSINLYADKLADTDVELYEFRLGGSWSGSIFLAALRAPNLSLFGVKPGSHTFIANTLGNNGIYGDTPQTSAVVLKDPPDGWAVQSTKTDDYTVF